MNIFLDALKRIYGTGAEAFTKLADITGGGVYDLMHQREEPLKVMPQPKPVVPTVQPTQVPQPTMEPTATPIPRPQTYPSPTPPPVSQNASLPQDRLQFLEKYLLPETRAMGLPDALVASQWASEGGRVQDNPQHNLFGLGPGMEFPSLQEGVQAYGRTVNSILDRKGAELPENASAYDYLMALQNPQGPRYEGHLQDPYEYTNMVMNTPEWRYYFK